MVQSVAHQRYRPTICGDLTDGSSCVVAKFGCERIAMEGESTLSPALRKFQKQGAMVARLSTLQSASAAAAAAASTSSASSHRWQPT